MSMFDNLNIPVEAEVCVIEPPSDYPTDSIDPFTAEAGSQFDVVKVYVKEPSQFAEEVAEGIRLMKPEGKLWVAFPKTDRDAFSPTFLQQQAAPLGAIPGKTVSMDSNWNATEMRLH